VKRRKGHGRPCGYCKSPAWRNPCWYYLDNLEAARCGLDAPCICEDYKGPSSGPLIFGVIIALLALLISVVMAFAQGVKDRACTSADIARVEAMIGVKRGGYAHDPRFQLTIHYLGTAISNGMCVVRIKPVE
jgi:hypothetical protein